MDSSICPAEPVFWLILALFVLVGGGIIAWIAGTVIWCFVYELPKEWVKSSLIPWLKGRGYWPLMRQGTGS